MRNPILQQLLPSMNETDIRATMRYAMKALEGVADKIETLQDTIQMCAEELSSRDRRSREGAEILRRYTRPDND